MGRYEADQLFVKDRRGNNVAAKYLKDTNGNYIMDGSTGRPYVVPADFNLDAVIAKYKRPDWQTLEPIDIATRLETYAKLYQNFQTGQPDDLQTAYNGKVGASRVKDFRPAASYVFGAACSAAGLTLHECMAGGGVYNYIKSEKPDSKIDVSGVFGNNPDNVQDIEQGYRSQFDPNGPQPSPMDVKFTDSGKTAIVTENGHTSVYKAVTGNSNTAWKYVPVEGGGIDAAIKSGVYTVQRGNVLEDIAAKFHTTVQKIMEANPDIENPDSIRAGQRIVLPKDDLSSPTENPKDLDPARQSATDRGVNNDRLSRSILPDDGVTRIASSNVGQDVDKNTAAALANDASRTFPADPASPFAHALDAVGLAPGDVHLTPAGGGNSASGSYDIRDKDTSDIIGSCVMTPTGCEVTAGDDKVVMDRLSGSDVSLKTYAKNDDGDFEFLGMSRISGNDGITTTRPLQAY